MSLGARQGDSLVITVQGPDEEAAIGYLVGFLKMIL